MDDGTEFKRYDRKTKFIKDYKGQVVVESHDRLRPEGAQHIKKKMSFQAVCDHGPSQRPGFMLL